MSTSALVRLHPSSSVPDRVRTVDGFGSAGIIAGTASVTSGYRDIGPARPAKAGFGCLATGITIAAATTGFVGTGHAASSSRNAARPEHAPSLWPFVLR